jgi:hypothetical protein
MICDMDACQSFQDVLPVTNAVFPVEQSGSRWHCSRNAAIRARIAVLMTLNPATLSTIPQTFFTAPSFSRTMDQPSHYNQALTQTRHIDRARYAKGWHRPWQNTRFSSAVDSRFREQNPPVAFPKHGVPPGVILGRTLAAQALSRIYRVISGSYRVIDKTIAVFHPTIPDGKLEHGGIVRS